MSRFTVSDEGEENTTIPAIIATTITPIITPFLFMIQNSWNRLKKLIPNYVKIFF
jgi:hypothetical protein